MKEIIKTEMQSDGLRYISKSTGSDFPGAPGATMSCFRCGRHVARRSLRSFRVAGALQFCCSEDCRPGRTA